MRFGAVPVAEAVGALLVHSFRRDGIAFAKGRCLSADDAAALAAAGVGEIVVCRLDPADVPEDEAARRVAAAVAGDGIEARAAFTGRVNLLAAGHGLLLVDAARLDRLNSIDEAVTVATLPPHTIVAPRQMAATVKIIPYAAAADSVAAAEAVAREAAGLIRLAPFRARRAVFIQTILPGLKPSVLEKTAEITRQRLEAYGSALVAERRVPHQAAAVAAAIAEAAAGADLVLAIGASAVSDRSDVLPAAIEAAGGTVEHFGMPVDPGNLLLFARVGGVPVLGLPGCARSPKLNGFDWILARLCADVAVSRQDIMRMGVGGLLTEIASRPQPRVGRQAPAPLRLRVSAPKIAAIVLAAGRSTRMGRNKLLEPVGGVPMVVRAVDAALASAARPVVVVTGHKSGEVTAALGGRPVAFADNTHFAAGIATSLRVGLDALPPDVEGALILLGDMPLVAATTLERLIAAFDPDEGRSVVVPTFGGRRGNPVLWDRGLFPAMRALTGDSGARQLFEEHADLICEVATEDSGVLIDLDTPEALAAVSG